MTKWDLSLGCKDGSAYQINKCDISSVQSLSRVWLCDSMDCSMPDLPVHHQLPEFTQTHAHWVHDAIQPSHPLSSPSLPSIFPSIRVFSTFISGGPSIGVSASTSVLPMTFQDLFPLGWTGWICLQSKALSSSKTSILQRSAFFIAQLSHPYMTTGKTIALTRWTFVGKVMSLLFNTLSRWYNNTLVE